MFSYSFVLCTLMHILRLKQFFFSTLKLSCCRQKSDSHTSIEQSFAISQLFVLWIQILESYNIFTLWGGCLWFFLNQRWIIFEQTNVAFARFLNQITSMGARWQEVVDWFFLIRWPVLWLLWIKAEWCTCWLQKC